MTEMNRGAETCNMTGPDESAETCNDRASEGLPAREWHRAPSDTPEAVCGHPGASETVSVAVLLAAWEATARTPAESEWDEGFRDGHAECARQLRGLLERRDAVRQRPVIRNHSAGEPCRLDPGV